MDSLDYDADYFEEADAPVVWIGIYISIASFFCVLAMAADLFHGFRNKKLWFPCKYFSVNAASIMVITVTLKLPVDLSTAMPSYTDQAAKVGSLAFMCMMMANLTPSLASMDNKTLLANVTGLAILVITVIVNTCIQIKTGVIEHVALFTSLACIYTTLSLLLLMIIISSSLTIPTSKEILESKYRAANKSLTDQSVQHIQMCRVEKLRHHVKRYWVMAETGSPQFVMASNPLTTASGVICVSVMVVNFLLEFEFMYSVGIRKLLFDARSLGESPYRASTAFINIVQFIGVMVGTIAPLSRCFLVFSFKNYFMVFKVEKYWTEKLHEWKRTPVLFLSSSPRSRSVIYSLKNNSLSLCIGHQNMVVILCKVTWLIVTVVPIYVVRCFTSLIASRTDDIDEDLTNYVLQIDNERALAVKTLKGISESMIFFISKAEKEQQDDLLELLKKSTGFKGVEILDADHVQPLLSVELVNSWSLPIVTLTCIAIALPNIPKDRVEKLFRSVGEGLSYTHLVEESLNCSSEYVNLRKASLALWKEVENKCKWLGNPLANNVFNGKTTTKILKWFSDKAKEIVTKTNRSTNEKMMENPPKTLIEANLMYQITQTILLRYQSNTEPITKKQLFAHLIKDDCRHILCLLHQHTPSHNNEM